MTSLRKPHPFDEILWSGHCVETNIDVFLMFDIISEQQLWGDRWKIIKFYQNFD